MHLKVQAIHAKDQAFPYLQLGVLAIIRLAEPIALASILPYAYPMVQSFHMGDKAQAATYAGILVSSFSIAEASVCIFWGMLSDRIGRKPVMLMGCAGTLLSMVLFGFATNFWFALVARCLGGLLNGNIGVIQTMVGEICKNPEHEPRAFAIMPIVWLIGTIIGPSIAAFSIGHVFPNQPYLLPNLICASLLTISLVAGWFFLDETHPDFVAPGDNAEVESVCVHDDSYEAFPYDHGHRRDSIMSARQSVAGRRESILGNDHRIMWPLPGMPPPQGLPVTDLQSLPMTTAREHSSLRPRGSVIGQNERILRPRESIIGRDGRIISHMQGLVERRENIVAVDEETPLLRVETTGVHHEVHGPAFTRRVVMLIIALGLFCYHSMSFDHLFPILLVDDRGTGPVIPTGGLGLSQQKVGVVMSTNGILALIVQLFIFPPLANKVGVFRLFQLSVLLHPLVYIGAPLIVALPAKFSYVGIYTELVVRNMATIVLYPLLLILIKEAAPRPSALGRINGLAASCGSLTRALAPPIAGLLYGQGEKNDIAGLAWWATAIVSVIGIVQLTCITHMRKVVLDDGEAAEEGVVIDAGVMTYQDEQDKIQGVKVLIEEVDSD